MSETRESRPQFGEPRAAKDLADGRSTVDSTGSDLFGVGFDPVHEARLQAWAEGWDAAVSWLWPLLTRANADADRLYRAAFAPSPKPKFGPSYAERRRATAELQEQRAREWQEARR